MKRTADQNRALAWFVQEYKLRPELSTHPKYRFTTPLGKIVTHSMQYIEQLYNAGRKNKNK